MQTPRFLYGTLAGLLVAGCAGGVPQAATEQKEPVPPTATATARAAAEASNRFSIDAYKVLAAERGNLFFSPFSAEVALAMTAGGARGDTRAEMLKVLHLDGDAAGFKDLLAALPAGAKGGYELRAANAVWAQSGYPWRPEFNTHLTDRFGAGLHEADFQSNPDRERQRVNAWAKENTAGKIENLLPEKSLTPDTRMVLVNAVYFKGRWAEMFDARRTRPAPFTRADGTKKDVPMMFREGGFRLLRVPGKDGDPRRPELSVAEIPYQGNGVTLVVLLPGRPDGLPALEKKLTPQALAGWLAEAKEAKHALLHLPKFRLETEYNLNEPLKTLGMPRAFDLSRADFTGMHSGREQLFISLVVQKAFVEVNEAGTEAAAATAVEEKKSEAKSEPPSFTADHPFLFLLRHVSSNTLLFVGRYEAP